MSQLRFGHLNIGAGEFPEKRMRVRMSSWKTLTNFFLTRARYLCERKLLIIRTAVLSFIYQVTT